MKSSTILNRVTRLEKSVEELREQLRAREAPQKPWWEEIAGKFANDPVYDEAMRLGREYRESLRPKSLKRKGRNGRSRH